MAEQDKWSREELKAAVIAYFEMLNKSRNANIKVKLNKAQYYRELAERFGRTPKAFERRMSNISSVLHLQGREWLEGLKPLSNVGSNVAKEIEEIIAELEQRDVDPRVEFESKYREALKKKVLVKPTGDIKPKRYKSTIWEYYRRPEVKAWVIQQAKDHCELCDQHAPFQTDGNLWFLEVHHLRRLADGGSDRIENTVALCPNCHREMHYGVNRDEKLEILYTKVSRLVRE